MTSLTVRPYRQSLFKRVSNTTIQSSNFGLVALFGQKSKWMNRPVEEREPGQVRALYIFLHAIEMKPVGDDSNRWEELSRINQGQPAAVKALNVLEARAGRDERWVQNLDYEPEEP